MRRVLKRLLGPKRDKVTGGENCIMRRLITCTVRKYNENDQAQEDEMDRSCSTHGGRRLSINSTKEFYVIFYRKEVTHILRPYKGWTEALTDSKVYN
jgi:hypothetical protein